MFKRILIANRGEIAVRIIRACRDLGVQPVAVFSQADRTARHVREADLAVPIGPAPAAQSYLNSAAIIEACRGAKAEAIHPGYGFLAENPAFARAVKQAGLVFIGPSAEAIEQMGDKVRARGLMAAAGVPVVPGSPATLDDSRQALALAREVGFPVMLKAAAGGGGKGMRLIEQEAELEAAVRAVASEARSAFGDGRFYLEKYLDCPRHIEVQVLADAAGRTVHLFERECSIQRRHQKVVEETPSPFVTPAMRREMGEIAVRAARAVNYLGAGTIEFLVDARRNFYFLEMNTRIQVEHPVTEMVTGVDLVKAQIEIAAGGKLPAEAEHPVLNGWALECRIYAEDPAQGFTPAPGAIEVFRPPEGPGVRHDSGVYPGAEVPVYYDPIISKLITWGNSRAEAIGRMRRALGEFTIAGRLATNLDFHRWLMDHPRFIAGDFDTRFIAQEFKPAALARAAGGGDDEPRAAALVAAALAWQEAAAARQPATRAGGAGLSPWKMAARTRLLGR